jgi:hypothetical protein
MAYTTIDDPSAYFQTKLYTGNGGALAVTNDGNSDLQPDWAWFKKRGAAEGHALVDTSRGIDRFLASNSEAVEQHQPTTGNTDADDIASFDSDGFTFSGGGGAYNQSSNTYVAWQWKCNGGSTTSFTESGNNPGGTIQTNTDAGFSIITTTGTGGAGTIAHGLGAVPHWIISKCRSNSGGWVVYHQANTSAPETDALNLSSTGATVDAVAWFNDTAPTSSVFTVGTTGDLNGDGRTNIHYVFTEKQGYSKFGSYTGNSNADGAFVYTGFKPAFVLVTASNATENWLIVDNKRTQSFNAVDGRLIPNSNAAEETNLTPCDLLSNGIKWRTSDGVWNSSSNTHIYMAFAEHPFVSSEGVPTTAR